MRWKALFFNKNSINKNQNNHFGLASNKTPYSFPEMKPFETVLIKLIENIQFLSGKKHFQKCSANDLKKINSSPNIFIFADKTRNIYEALLDTYNKLLHDNITKTYKHGSEDTIDEIDSELKDISNNLGIGDKIDKMKNREAFISLKDHKKISRTIQNVR